MSLHTDAASSFIDSGLRLIFPLTALSYKPFIRFMAISRLP